MGDISELEKIARLIRYYILFSTTEAGSGHPTSALSATELMTGLLFGGAFRFDLDKPNHPNNDRLIFSKGHATPLFYALWAAAGRLSEQDLRSYRKFGSPLEGHPTVAFQYTEAATGSLGQGLSIGFGEALNAKYIDKLPYRTYVLLGDSEMAEGSQWESIALAAHYKLDNLVGIMDVNRLGQRGETMFGCNLQAYAGMVSAFGWEPVVIDGHNFKEVLDALNHAGQVKDKPVMIIAGTVKGKGVSFLEDKNGWHGKALNRDEFRQAIGELGAVDMSVLGNIMKPDDVIPVKSEPVTADAVSYDRSKPFATREAYGRALRRIFPQFPDMVVLDGEVSNSTYAEIFRDAYPDRFFEMFIAEQNMAGAAIGLARRGKLPFVSTFAAFLTRAFDQIRMGQYSRANIKFCGSHAGVSIGEDGPSQMGLEDIAMFRTVKDCVVFYPSDAVSTEKLVEAAAQHKGMVYIRTTRMKTPILYDNEELFTIGGSKILKRSDADKIAIIAAGVTLHEALKASEELMRDDIFVRVIDLYGIKPIDVSALREAVASTRAIITVEDHAPEGGIGEAVRSALPGLPIHSLAVRKMPRSGKPDELLLFEEISKEAIIRKVKELI
ncbi:MAG TPA: transketolase [Dissulfurispiraceae bacterium]|nr:transketolase [Dissulfurispiraceae bacterium]